VLPKDPRVEVVKGDAQVTAGEARALERSTMIPLNPAGAVGAQGLWGMAIGGATSPSIKFALLSLSAFIASL